MSRSVRLIVIGCALLLTLAGCARFGPEILRSGRPAYNDAILATNDEQLLQNIVRLRFADSVGFLTVSSVTANVSMTASGTVNAGLGSPANYQGNLVPFAGTLKTEQNPTISYTPVRGDRIMRQILGETPIDLALLLINGASKHSEAWTALIRRVNNVRNPDFLESPAFAPDPRFGEIAALIGELQKRGSLYWVRVEGAKKGYAMVLHSYAPASSHEAARLLELLGIPKPAQEGDDAVVPIQLAVGSPPPGAIVIETRSLFHLMQLAAAGIDLPADLQSVARQYPEPGPAGRGIRILSSATRPAQARLVVEYQDRWYYIADGDLMSKQWFRMLQLLANAQVLDPAGSRSGPVLTIPTR